MSVSTAISLTVREYSAKLGVSVHQILGWINSGQLRALNVSSKLGSGRPTWRIPLDAICEFEGRRSARGPAVKASRGRPKKKDPNFVNYF